jgi:polar amino acid transport system substrate-binding protein
MKVTRLWLLISLLAVLAALTAAGCGSDDSSSTSASTGGSSGDELGLIEAGTLTVGSDIPYPPFEQGSPPDYTGFDIDLVDEIADRLGLDPKIVDTSFATIFSDQQAGKFDMVASSSTITPARQQKVTFSDPYFDADQSLMVQKGSDLTNVDQITGDTRIAVQQGTTGQEYAESETDGQVQGFPEIGTAFNALQAGQVDAVINDFAVSAFALKKYPDLDVIQTIPTHEQYGFPMQKTNTALIDAVNGALGDMIDDGTYEEIFKKWFTEEPPEDFQPSS